MVANNKDFYGAQGLPAFTGVVEDRKDPLMLGRARVRIHGWHTANKLDMPTENLPWAVPITPLDSGRNPVGLKEGDWVFGYFLDGAEAQHPIIAGVIPGIPETTANPAEGFNDPRTPDELLQSPLPPAYQSDTTTEVVSLAQEVLGLFADPNKLPGENTAFGELVQDFDPKHYKFDVNKDGKFDAKDALLLIDPNLDGIIDTFTGIVEYVEEKLAPSNYPLEAELKEPTTSRLARNENIDKTIVAKKKGALVAAETASHAGTGIATDASVETEGFGEPETKYDAEYPYNHVYESESGHVTEIDDTPGAERLHQYHRSGSFTEFHPDGTTVRKSVVDAFNLAGNNNNNYAKKDYNISAEELLTAIGKVINIQSREALNIDSGTNTNHTIGEDHLVKVGANQYTIVGENRMEVIKGDYSLTVEGDFKIKCHGITIIDASGIELKADAICSEAVGNNLVKGITVSLDGVVCANQLAAHTAGEIGATPPPAVPCTIILESDVPEEIPEVAKPKPGFILDAPGVGYLYKPISESDGNLITLSLEVASHELYEAVPTGILETVTIQYLQADNTITSWTVVRPVHKKGKLIDRGTFKAIANGGRAHYKWSKPGAEYPTQMIWSIGGKTDWLILNSAVRHD